MITELSNANTVIKEKVTVFLNISRRRIMGQIDTRAV
jgi:hypothetical protein